MNTNERDALRAAIDAYRRYDLTAAVARAYPDQSDLGSFMIGAFSAENLVVYANQLMANFEEVLANGLWVSIPGQSIEAQRRVNHVAVVQQFLNAVEQSALEQVSTLLAQLIGYQMDHGIWRLPEQGSSVPDAAELKQVSDRIKAQTKRLEEAQAYLEQLLGRIESERSGLSAFANEKRAEFEELRKMVSEAKQNLNAIIASLEEAKKKEAVISEIEAAGRKTVESLSVELGVVKKELEAFKTSATELQGKLTSDAGEANRVLELAKQLYEFVKGKESEIIRLTGMAADGSMGNKFEDRGSKLDPPLKFWRVMVGLAALLSIVWVVVVFLCFRTIDLDPWANLLVNILKTSPMLVILGFSMAQYTKERNLREEYAFKAAVAMTITAYADLLNERDGETNLSRQKLILQALANVHTPPKLHSEKGGSLFSWRAKELRGTLEQLNESIKGIKDAARP